MDHPVEAELARLGDAAVGVSDVPELARQAELAEGGERLVGGRRDALRGGGERQRDREVGARLVHPHAAGDRDEHVGRAERDAGVAAEHGEHERQPVAVHAVGHAPRRDDLARATSACTSTSSGREPSMAHRTTEPGRARGLADEARGGVLDLDQPLLVHLEDADLVGRAEAVLERAQRAVGALALALEREHAVDEVLEHARSGERALLRHVADEQRGDAALLRHSHQPPGDLPHLRHRAGRSRQSRVVEDLHRVDDAHVRPLAAPASRRPPPDPCPPRSEPAWRAGPSRSARSFTWAADSSPDT